MDERTCDRRTDEKRGWWMPGIMGKLMNKVIDG